MSDLIHEAVFLSYASQDAERVRGLCQALQAEGVEVWFDQGELRGGDVWDQKIKKQIRECALFVPVISAHTNARSEGYFRLEWKLAVDRSHLIADDALFLVSAVIDEMTDAAARVPDRFRDVQWSRVLKERVGGHPNIVRLLDVHFDEPPYYVEMDYVEGRDLKSWCEQQGGVAPVPLATRLELVAQIADALHAAHTAGVVHRDVKPGNILVAQAATPAAPPVAKLSDFGIGQVISEEALSGVTKGGFTESIVVDSSSSRSGTQLYMAPELAAGQPASVRTDLHSLGLVLFQLVVGDPRRPLTTDWSREVGVPILREDLARCFSSRAGERFATADELSRALRAHDERLAAHQRDEAARAAQQRAAKIWRRVRAAARADTARGYPPRPDVLSLAVPPRRLRNPRVGGRAGGPGQSFTRQGGRDSPGHGPGHRHDDQQHGNRPAGGATRALLSRPPRSDQPGFQGLCRSRRLHEA